jgi:cell division inhibitor SepF
MAFWKSAMNYLGLGPDDAYDDYDLAPEADRPAGRPSRAATYSPDTMDSGAVRTVPNRPRSERDMLAPRPVPSMDDSVPVRRPSGNSSVRAVPSSVPGRPYTVRPRSFNQAQEVADRFKEGQAVIVNLEGVERDVSRRLIDFASGLCYGLGGTMEKVATGVYLLQPPNVSLSAEDRRSISGPSEEY